MKCFLWVPLAVLLPSLPVPAQVATPAVIGLVSNASNVVRAPVGLLEAQRNEDIPDSPGTVAHDRLPDAATRKPSLYGIAPQDGDPDRRTRRPRPVPCVAGGEAPPPVVHPLGPEAASAAQARQPCGPAVNPYENILNGATPVKLTPGQKGYLAVQDMIDPFNILTIVANSAFSIGINPHTAYGPGMRGFGRNVGISMVQDATGELIGTYAVCSLFHQDPHYYRMPNARPLRRVGHVLAHTFIAQSDSGKPMLNFENLITYPASAEISNLYVPGIADNGPSTAARILTGLATDPIGSFIAEFLPDFARRIHVRIVIVQQILNQIASGERF